MFDLSGQVALVTGGNSGIGLGLAEGLVRAGATVCIWGTNAAKNAAALEQLGAAAPDATVEAAIVTRWGDAEDWQGIAAYLASRESSFHTGDVFRIDGGYGNF